MSPEGAYPAGISVMRNDISVVPHWFDEFTANFVFALQVQYLQTEVYVNAVEYVFKLTLKPGFFKRFNLNTRRTFN